ncbi:hypothetical protein D3C85_905110 [compost metagenome]
MARIEHRQLAFQANRRTGHQRLASGHAGGVHRAAGGEVVAAVDHHVDRRHRGGQAVGVQRLAQRLQRDMRVERGETRHGRIDLGLADAGRVVDHLALQVGQIDRIEVGQLQLADPGRGQVQRHRRAETTEADDQHAALLEPQLAVDVDLGQEDLPAVAQQFVVTQHAVHPQETLHSSGRG